MCCHRSHPQSSLTVVAWAMTVLVDIAQLWSVHSVAESLQSCAAHCALSSMLFACSLFFFFLALLFFFFGVVLFLHSFQLLFIRWQFMTAERLRLRASCCCSSCCFSFSRPCQFFSLYDWWGTPTPLLKWLISLFIVEASGISLSRSLAGIIATSYWPSQEGGPQALLESKGPEQAYSLMALVSC